MQDKHEKRHAAYRRDFDKLMAELPEAHDLKADRLKQQGENVVAFDDPSKPKKTASEMIQEFIAKVHSEDYYDPE